MSVYFTSDEHLDSYLQLREQFHVSDRNEDKEALLYLVTSDALRDHLADIIDLDNSQLWVKRDAPTHEWNTKGTAHLIHLAFDLYTDWIADDECPNDFTPLNILAGLDSTNFEVAIQAMRIRFRK